MKFILLALIGALVYHAVQIHGFMQSAWGIFLPKDTSFLNVFLKTLFESAPFPALQSVSGPTNVGIGGSIGFGVALAIHFLRPRDRSEGDRTLDRPAERHPISSLPNSEGG